MDLDIKNKKVLITGSSRGIGKEIANQFANEGCKLILIARNEEKLKEVINKYDKPKGYHNYIAVDLRQPNEPSNVAKKIINDFGGPDIVIHNVGGNLGANDILAELNEWKDTWMFNVGIAIEINKILIPKMIENKWGRIVSISSSNAVSGGTMSTGEAPAPLYTCAKTYLNMYTKVLGRELAKYNIIVSAVMPGAIMSKGKYWDRLSKTNPEIIKSYLKNHYSIGRFGNSKEIAPFVLLLSSKHASFAASSIVSVDGGYI